MSQGRSDSSDCRSAGTVGEMLRCFRERRLWTQAVLAERAGLPEKTISSLETGARRRPHLTTLEMLADALELDAADRDALRAGRDGRPPVTAPLSGPTAAPLLPLPATPFVGRDEPARQVIALLERPEVRLLTLTGTGGIGKTRLALHVAESVADRFADGAFFVDCAAVRDPAQIPGAIAYAIALHVPGGQPVEAALTDYFAGRHVLLILDNMEQVLEAATFVDRLVASSPGLVVIVTSRERLALAREHVFLVGAMAVPDPTADLDSEAIAQSESVQLFVQRARAAQARFALTPANAADVTAICAGLDGIPLAIELAAARLAHVGAPGVLRERLDRRLAWLATNLRDMEPRHRTMRAAIEWSYDTLEPEEQRLFRHLAVFAGGFTIDAAEAISVGEADRRTDGKDSPSLRLSAFPAVLDGIASLVDKNLIQLYDGPDGGTRYRMLETIREFALERLGESGEESAVRTTHAATYLDLAERGEEELSGPNQRGWLARLSAEGDNIRSALEWMIAQCDAERSCRLGSALWRFWAASGRVEEGRRLMEQALALTTVADPSVRAKALRRFGNLAVEQADYAAARTAFVESMELARAVGDEAARVQALSSVGYVAYNLGDYKQARICLEEALAAWDGPAAARDRASALYSLGEVAFAEGRIREAEDLLRACLSCRDALGDELGVGYASLWLGQIARVNGRIRDARLLLEKALPVFRTNGDRPGEGSALLELAQLARADGDAAGSHELARQSLVLRRSLGDAHHLVDAIEVVAVTLFDRGEGEMAACLAGAAAEWRRTHGVPLTPPLRAPYDAALAMLRDHSGEQGFATAFKAGETMTVERAASTYLESAV